MTDFLGRRHTRTCEPLPCHHDLELLAPFLHVFEGQISAAGLSWPRERLVLGPLENLGLSPSSSGAQF